MDKDVTRSPWRLLLLLLMEEMFIFWTDCQPITDKTHSGWTNGKNSSLLCPLTPLPFTSLKEKWLTLSNFIYFLCEYFFFQRRPKGLSPPTTIFRQTFSLLNSCTWKTANSFYSLNIVIYSEHWLSKHSRSLLNRTILLWVWLDILSFFPRLFNQLWCATFVAKM